MSESIVDQYLHIAGVSTERRCFLKLTIGVVGGLAIRVCAVSSAGNTSLYPVLAQDSIDSLLQRSIAALLDARTYKYVMFSINQDGSRSLAESGEVDLNVGKKVERTGSSGPIYTTSSGWLSSQDSEGTWYVEQPPVDTSEELENFVRNASVDDIWFPDGSDVIAGAPATVIARMGFAHGQEYLVRLWIDDVTSLPIKNSFIETSGSGYATETTYSDFGTPVDVVFPAEAAAILQDILAEEERIASVAEDQATRVATVRESRVNRLLESPFPESELPSGFSGVVVAEGDVSEFAEIVALARVDITIAMPGPLQQISYLFFHDRSMAESAIDGLLHPFLSQPPYSSGTSAMSNNVFSDTETGFASQVVSRASAGMTEAMGLIKYDNIVIRSYLWAEGENRDLAEEHAAMLSFAGLRHLTAFE